MSEVLVLRNARVVDGRGVRAEGADVLIADGRIRRIGGEIARPGQRRRAGRRRSDDHARA